MEERIAQLQKSALFAGIKKEDVEKMFMCFAFHKRKVDKGTFIFRAGDDIHKTYLIMKGRMHIIDEDFWGNRSIIETMEADTLFGEAYVLSSATQHLVSVVAAQDSVVFEIEPTKMLEACPQGCDCHTKVIRNVAYILSEKIVRLTEKLGHVMRRTTREKVSSYLSMRARQEKSSSFSIPYSRQQLAEYLCVDRSALSHELSKMRDLKIIQYHKNHFELLS